MKWWMWLLIGIVAGAGGSYFSFTPRVNTTTVTKEVIKWKTVERIKTMPGAVTTLRPDGTTVIEGPVEFTRSSEGGVTREAETSVILSRRSDWSLGGGIGIKPFVPVPIYVVSFGKRIIGPMWAEAWGTGLPITVGILLRIEW